MHAVRAVQACTNLAGHICQALLSDITFPAGRQLVLQLLIFVASMQQQTIKKGKLRLVILHVLALHVQFTASAILSALRSVYSE